MAVNAGVCLLGKSKKYYSDSGAVHKSIALNFLN